MFVVLFFVIIIFVFGVGSVLFVGLLRVLKVVWEFIFVFVRLIVIVVESEVIIWEVIIVVVFKGIIIVYYGEENFGVNVVVYVVVIVEYVSWIL